MFRNASRPQPRHRKAGRAVVRRRGAALKLPAFLDAPDFDGDIDAWVNFPDPLDPTGILLGSPRVNAAAFEGSNR